MVKTSAELLADVMDPNHPSQEYFAKLGKDGKMLETCRQNGYSFSGGYGMGGARSPNYSNLRAETRLHQLVEELSKTNPQ